MAKRYRPSNQKLDVQRSREMANNRMREICPNLDWHIHCVHHKDENPFNNALSNLEVMKRADHNRHHAALKVKRLWEEWKRNHN